MTGVGNRSGRDLRLIWFVYNKWRLPTYSNFRALFRNQYEKNPDISPASRKQTHNNLNRKGVTPIVYVLCMVCSVVFAKAETAPVFRHFGVAEGLAGNGIYHMLTDREGRIWASTNRGVVCYDGVEFKTYTIRDGLPENKAIKMYEDAHGKIWCIGLREPAELFRRWPLSSL